MTISPKNPSTNIYPISSFLVDEFGQRDFLFYGLCQVVRERLLELRVQTKGLKVQKKRRLELELKLVTGWDGFSMFKLGQIGP